MNEQRIELSGSYFNETFEGKHVVYSGGDLHLEQCTFKNGTFGVEGDAASGVKFMKAMFNAGAKCSVMKTFLSDDEYEKVKNVLGWEGVDGN
ncbi:hypothetical protein NVP1033O_03 [Vibrio phage 1.033.O._10N.222.49.B8]|nr:hypothetical protein NVP1033O_03 [Vibrio phage 1.033.O._10N.222.49.B8]